MRKVVYISNLLSKHGFVPSIGEMLTQSLSKEGYHVIKASSVKNKFLRLLDMLFTIFKNRKNAIVIIATYSTSAFYFACACSILCRLFNIKYIPSLHGGSLPKRIKRSPVLSQQLFGNSYTNIVISPYLSQCMKENNWPSLYIQNPIRIENYPFKERKDYAPKLLWVRSFHEIYNPQLAVEILHELRKTYANATLTMVGPDKDGSMRKCKELAGQAGLIEQIQFTGFLPKKEWTKLAQTHDIFVNTTNIDNLPVSVIEAMALGMIIVTTNVGGIKYLVQNYVNGVSLEPKNAEAFVRSIENILSNKKTGSILSRNARATAENYAWDNVKHKWNQLLQKQELYC